MKTNSVGKKSISWFVSVLLILGVLFGTAFTLTLKNDVMSASGLNGLGTQESPFLISTAADMDQVRNYLGPTHKDKYFKMTNNISLKDYTNWNPIGTGGNANTSFQGTFDGDGYNVTGLTITRTDTNYQGLFGSVFNGLICNLGIESGSIVGGDRTGGIAGYINHATIRNSYNKASVGNVRIWNDPGGIAGYAENYAVINQCYNAGQINGEVAGGICGTLLSWSAIQDCYNTGVITGLTNDTWTPNDRLAVGGIVGYLNSGSITKVYNAGRIERRAEQVTQMGALVGQLVDINHTAIGAGVYYDSEASGVPYGIFSNKDVSAARTTEQMYQKSTYTGLDFVDTWYMHDGATMPQLKKVGGQSIKQEYKLAFDGNGATTGSMDEMVVPLRSSIVLPAVNFTRTGYTFDGWSTAKDGPKVYADKGTYEMTVSSASTLYARWAANQNTLNFEPNEPTATGTMNPIKIGTNQTVSLPLIGFSAAGYSFAGWSTAANGAVEYANGASYTMGTGSSYTLYAIWSAGTNLVRFNPNGATGVMPSQQIITGGSAQLNPNEFVYEGYEFKGWSTMPHPTADTTVDYADGGTVTNMPATGIDLYAIWVPNVNTITFYANEGTGMMDAQEFFSGQTVTLKANVFTRAGYKFVGWATSPSNQAVYADKGVYDLDDRDISLYAKWAPNVNTIVFHPNAIGVTGVMFDQQISTGESVALNLNAFIRTGYEFMGWATSSGGGKVYNDGDVFSMGTASTNNLYAVWSQIANLVRFHPNGGTGSMSDQSINQGSGANLQLNAFTRPGYLFDGWSVSLNGTRDYEDGAMFNMGNIPVNVLYARWIAKPDNRIMFNANGGTGSMASQTGATDSTIKLLTNKFTRVGYKFEGWSTYAAGTVEYEDGDDYKVTALDSTTLYAVWSFIAPAPKIEVAGGQDDSKTLTATDFDKVDGAEYSYEWQKRDENGDWITIEGENGESIEIPAGDNYYDYRVLVTVIDPDGGVHDSGFIGGSTGGDNGSGAYVDPNGDPFDGSNDDNVRSSGTISDSQRTIIIVAVVIGVIVLISIIVGVSVSVSREKKRRAQNW